jgi:hypothetical protein
MRKDAIIDFETFGKDASECAVIDCSVIFFEWDRFTSNNPYKLSEVGNAKRFKLSVTDQVKNYGWKVEKSAIDFWERQESEVRNKIKPKKDDLSVKDFTNEFLRTLSNEGKIEYWWSRSNTFDPIILQRLFNSQERLSHVEEYLKFWRVRDTRTFIDAKLNFPKKNGFVPIKDEEKWNRYFKEHDSAWDVTADLLRFQAISRAEEDLEMI